MSDVAAAALQHVIIAAKDTAPAGEAKVRALP
jgi:hypothetical protein